MLPSGDDIFIVVQSDLMHCCNQRQKYQARLANTNDTRFSAYGLFKANKLRYSTTVRVYACALLSNVNWTLN